MADAITNFLKTKRPKEELRTALEVLREFKECESIEEYLVVPFLAWGKFENLEEFLRHLVEGKPLGEATLEYMASQANKEE